jgi:hypothetical protein
MPEITPDASVTNSGFVIDFGITGIIIIAFAVVMLLLAVLAVIALFKQKSILNSIRKSLVRQPAVPPPMAAAAPAYMPPPAPDVCPKCGAPYVPGSVFCQNCGSSLK